MAETLTQHFISANEWYSLDYPRMWEMEVVENIPAFFDPLFGKGALQVFCVKTGDIDALPDDLAQYPFLKGESLQDKMLIFLQTQKVNIEPDDITVFRRDDIDFVANEYQQEERFYMVCMMQKEETFLLALYNCKDQPEKEEADNIGSILKSIRIA